MFKENDFIKDNKTQVYYKVLEVFEDMYVLISASDGVKTCLFSIAHSPDRFDKIEI